MLLTNYYFLNSVNFFSKRSSDIWSMFRTVYTLLDLLPPSSLSRETYKHMQQVLGGLTYGNMYKLS